MRFWFAPQSDVPLYRQLVTQVQLAILSGDLRPGDRLPSTRELARRFAIHPNTVSAGYRQLERDGWTELRPGSGVFVSERANVDVDGTTDIDRYVESFFRGARQAGLPMSALRSRLSALLATLAADHLLLIEPDQELQHILLTELRGVTKAEVRAVCPDDCTGEMLAGAVACCRPSQEQAARRCLSTGAELLVLPITSATQWLLPWLPAPNEHLIAVVSRWAEFLSVARTMLAAAGVRPEALLFRDARSPHWTRGLHQVSGILCDACIAADPNLPRGPQVVVFPLLGEGIGEALRLSGL